MKRLCKGAERKTWQCGWSGRGGGWLTNFMVGWQVTFYATNKRKWPVKCVLLADHPVYVINNTADIILWFSFGSPDTSINIFQAHILSLQNVVFRLRKKALHTEVSFRCLKESKLLRCYLWTMFLPHEYPAEFCHRQIKDIDSQWRRRVKINASHNIKSGVAQESLCKSLFALFITSSFTQWAQSVPLQMAWAEVCPGEWVHRAGGFNQAV